MSPLTTAASVMAAVSVCVGAEAEVPLRLTGWSAEDAGWLEKELSAWMAARDRTLCASAGTEQALTLAVTGTGATITFVHQGVRREREVPRGDDGGLFRYQVAAAAEELARSTWEEAPPPRFALLARGALSPLEGGAWTAGGGGGAALRVHPLVALELFGHVASLWAAPLAVGARVEGLQAGAVVALGVTLVRVAAFRAGLRAAVQAGVLSVSVRDDAGTRTGATPWLNVGGGAAVGLELRRVTVLAFGELGVTLAGAVILVEGVPAQRLRGLTGTFGVQAGWLL